MLWETVTVVALAVPENNNLRLNVHFTNKFVKMSKKWETYRRNAEKIMRYTQKTGRNNKVLMVILLKYLMTKETQFVKITT